MNRVGRGFVRLLLAGVLLVLLAGFSVARPEIKGRFAGSPNMTGDQVVPGPGDLDGSGEVVLQMRPPTRKSKKAHACAFLYLDPVEEPFRVRVHRGRKGETGPAQFSVAVEAHDPPRQDLDASGCRFDLSSRQINAVRRHERRYYAEVHTAELPDGAIRGQLRQYTDRSEPK